MIDTGRYNIKGRDIFRPIKYVSMYLKYDLEDMEWVTRELVHKSGLHIESIVKRLSNNLRLLLEQALANKVILSKIDKQIMSDLKLLVMPYNDSKHHVFP